MLCKNSISQTLLFQIKILINLELSKLVSIRRSSKICTSRSVSLKLEEEVGRRHFKI